MYQYTSGRHALFIYLAQEFLDKSLTVAYALALHTLKIWTHASNQALTLSTDKKAGGTIIMDPTG
jgi:hypothetical protein